MIVKTQFDSHDRVRTNPGCREKQLYKAHVNENGVIELKEDGKTSLYDEIQSYKDSCDINVIVKRYAAGDVDVLARKQGVFMDVTPFPKTYRELLDSVIQGEEYFMSLPVDVRAKFNHSFTEWMSAMDDMPSFVEKMGLAQDEQAGAKAAASGVAGAEGPSSEGGDA